MFRLSQPSGIEPDPGVPAPYLRVDGSDVWTGSNGSVVNQHRRCAPGTCPAACGAVERLGGYPGLWLTRWLRFDKAPVVSIGLGATPYAVIPNRYV